jgi:hypothetical protein
MAKDAKVAKDAKAGGQGEGACFARGRIPGRDWSHRPWRVCSDATGRAPGTLWV